MKLSFSSSIRGLVEYWSHWWISKLNNLIGWWTKQMLLSFLIVILICAFLLIYLTGKRIEQGPASTEQAMWVEPFLRFHVLDEMLIQNRNHCCHLLLWTYKKQQDVRTKKPSIHRDQTVTAAAWFYANRPNGYSGCLVLCIHRPNCTANAWFYANIDQMVSVAAWFTKHLQQLPGIIQT